MGDGAIAVYRGPEPPASCKVTAIRRAPYSTNGVTDETKTSNTAQARWSFTVADMNGAEKVCM